MLIILVHFSVLLPLLCLTIFKLDYSLYHHLETQCCHYLPSTVVTHAPANHTKPIMLASAIRNISDLRDYASCYSKWHLDECGHNRSITGRSTVFLNIWLLLWNEKASLSVLYFQRECLEWVNGDNFIILVEYIMSGSIHSKLV